MKAPKQASLVEAAYCCEFWAKHLCLGTNEEIRQLRLGMEDVQVLELFENCFLHWLESLGLLKITITGIEAIKLLIHAVQVRHIVFNL